MAKRSNDWMMELKLYEAQNRVPSELVVVKRKDYEEAMKILKGKTLFNKKLKRKRNHKK